MGLMDLTEGLCGCSCKMGRKQLEEMLDNAGLEESNNSNKRVLAGIGEDASVIELGDGRVLVESLDFFTPVTDDPYMQGYIAVNNGCNDLFAKGVTDITSILSLLALPPSIDVGGEILAGMKACAHDAGSVIVGGHTIQNPWPLTGVVATGIMEKEKVIFNSTSKPGDKLVLTKPLGIQVIINAYQELKNQEGDEDLKTLLHESMERAVKVMSEQSLPVAKVMQEVGVNAATDVTGFGLDGHSKEIARRSNVDFEIHTIPVIDGVMELSKLYNYPIESGKAAETCGGILISVEDEKTVKLIEMLEKNNVSAFEIGNVAEGSGKVNILDGVDMKEIRA